MRLRSARASLLSAFALLAVVFAASSQGCDPNQGEGERCDRNEDCASGLTCLSQEVCCPPDPRTSSSQDCRTLGGGAVVDSGSEVIIPETGTGADTNDAGADSIGKACKHTSECETPLVCLPGGTCGLECVGDRDCPAGDHCDCAVFQCAPGTTGGADHCGADTGTTADTTPPPDTTVDDTGSADTTLDDTADAAAE